ncbi:hypothetical protein O9X80_11145 [Agrobacterium salinitolerans]|uniref:hypothetical protein n=1 Tax=Agrobacterium salinitolerans TaxID=1183413 RepID=UPI0022B83EF8|nr:hypothetical protein [Agrobacterium salinitolerans]MCZ7975043.1 hypothetical protein [Agrobacterium salinitolerans]
MFEIAGGIVLAYLIIRFRHSIVAMLILIIAGIMSLFTGKQRGRFDRPMPGTQEHLQWANREGVWQYEPAARPSVAPVLPPKPKREMPPKPARSSPEYMDWANREGKWADED